VTGEGHQLHVAIENEEGRHMTYDVVVLAQRNSSVSDAEQLDTFEVQLEDSERAVVERTVAPTTIAEETRIQFLLYEGGSPSEPGAETADKSLQLWVDVVDSE